MKRTILRHDLGNREHMIQALMNHFCHRFAMETDELIAALPESNRVSELLNLLFNSQCAKENNSALIVQALMNASEQHPEINDRLMRSLLSSLMPSHMKSSWLIRIRPKSKCLSLPWESSEFTSRSIH